MKKIIEALFYGEINEADRKRRTKHSGEEQEAYDRFEESLTKAQGELFDKYYIENAEYISETENEIFERGVKIGFWLAVELFDFSLRE